MNILENIISQRREDIEAAKRRISVDELKELAQRRVHHSLAGKIQEAQGTCIIAEVKKASPSAGLFREDYQPAEIAREYQAAGAVGVSVLTEPNFFQGSGQHLREVRGAVDLPVLRKDFIIDAYQIYEAVAWGADVILLIVAALDEKQLQVLYEASVECGLEVLAEVHAEEELKAALALERVIIGVNSRNLSTLETDLSVARGLAEKIPESSITIAESGIHSRMDIENLEQAGYNGFLIGEALMSNQRPGEQLSSFLV
ncbi:indole-3-glycerol phosphate synthase TrpC [Verrucomicrobiota bacterium]